MSTCPLLPSLEMTRLGTMSCPATLRLDVVGRSRPVGHTVKNDGAVAPTAVTFRTAATAVVGTPFWPATAREIVDIDPIGAPARSRVSISRAGTIPTKSVPDVPEVTAGGAPGPACGGGGGRNRSS